MGPAKRGTGRERRNHFQGFYAQGPGGKTRCIATGNYHPLNRGFFQNILN